MADRPTLLFESVTSQVDPSESNRDRRVFAICSFTNRLPALYTGVMADKKHGESGREHERATEAVTTAVELNKTGTLTTAGMLGLSDPPPTPDTGTPLPDDPQVLKENVKGLKSQLRRQKLKVPLPSPSIAQEVNVAAVGRWIPVPQEEVLVPVRNHQLRPVCHLRPGVYLLCNVFAVGVFSAGWLIPPSKLPTLPEHIQVRLDEYEFTMPAMPTLDFSAEWERFKSNIPEPWKLANDGREFLVGEEMKSKGLEAKYPVVLIPGIISTASPPYACC